MASETVEEARQHPCIPLNKSQFGVSTSKLLPRRFMTSHIVHSIHELSFRLCVFVMLSLLTSGGPFS